MPNSAKLRAYSVNLRVKLKSVTVLSVLNHPDLLGAAHRNNPSSRLHNVELIFIISPI